MGELNCTIGEFLDNLKRDNPCEGRFWVQEVEQGGAAVEGWQQVRDSNDPKVLRGVVHLIARAIRVEVGHWSDPEPFQDSLKRGHEFLREIGRRAKQHGAELPADVIEQPLCSVDILVQNGLLQRVGDDQVELTDAGKAAADAVSRQIEQDAPGE